jgi:glucose/arabinose dehydrogenase
MRRHSITLAIIAAVLVGTALWLRTNIAPVPSGTSGPLTAASGWTVSLLTDKVPGARDMVLDQFGNVWVSQTDRGTVSLLYLKDAVGMPETNVILRNLRHPHGLAFDPDRPSLLYVATETAVMTFPTYSDGGLTKVADLPLGDRHFTRSLLFGGDRRLYISIGSTCDVCREKNPEYASIISMRADGSDRQIVAAGLRNSVFMAREPSSGGIWATEMGRDWLGDDLPPDEVNVILAGKNYGWPICYGDRIHDADFDKNRYIRDPCIDTVPPVIEIPAHSAPLGLAFLSDGDLVVAYHGSWNRTVPTGYKVVRWHHSFGGWKQSDLLTGFLQGGSVIDRPVDILPMPDGSLLISDDKAGAIWKMSPTR